MYRKIISAFQMLNILLQSLYSLALPIGVGALISFLTTRYLSAPKWIWAVLLTVGTFIGLYSMIKYILSATEALDRLKKEREESDAERRAKEERRARLSSELGLGEENEDESEGEDN